MICPAVCQVKTIAHCFFNIKSYIGAIAEGRPTCPGWSGHSLLFVVFLHSSDPIPSKQYHQHYMYFVDEVFGMSYIFFMLKSIGARTGP